MHYRFIGTETGCLGILGPTGLLWRISAGYGRVHFNLIKACDIEIIVTFTLLMAFF